MQIRKDRPAKKYPIKDVVLKTCNKENNSHKNSFNLSKSNYCLCLGEMSEHNLNDMINFLQFVHKFLKVQNGLKVKISWGIRIIQTCHFWRPLGIINNYKQNWPFMYEYDILNMFVTNMRLLSFARFVIAYHIFDICQFVPYTCSKEIWVHPNYTSQLARSSQFLCTRLVEYWTHRTFSWPHALRVFSCVAETLLILTCKQQCQNDWILG